jgi:8-oxo-dGTP diphosphatase
MPNIGVERSLVCPADLDDDHIHVVAAVIWRRDSPRHFLIARRQEGKHLAYYWELPGGKVEAGESPRQALQRELVEEINIKLVSATQFMQVYHRYPDRNILLDTWIVDDYQDDVVPREQQALAWIECNQISAYRFPDADLPILDALRGIADASCS